MPTYQAGTHSGPNDFIEKLKDFALANGWTIHYFGVWSGNHRLHLSKSGAMFAVWYASAAAANLRGHTSYDAGLGPADQPGISPAGTAINYLAGGSQYLLVAFESTIFIGVASGGGWYYAALGLVTEKIGVWSDGAYLFSSHVSFPAFSATAFQAATLRINGAWTPLTQAGGFCGSLGNDTGLTGKMPSEYNAGLLLLPVALFVRRTDNGSFLRPVGFVSGLRRAAGGNVYSQGDIITRLEEQWLIYPDLTAGNLNPANLFRIA